MPLLVRRLLWSPFIAFFAATLLIAGCSKSSTDAGLEKEDLDGDGIANIYDPDIDGDGIPNGSDPDIDGDGIPNDKDPDIDGDGKPNGKDPDIDGDGKPNEIDNTPIGDTWGPGTPGQCPGDASGTYPNCACPSGSQYNAQSNDCVADNPAGIGVEDPGIRYCDQIQVYGLNEEQSTGSIISISWQLQSSKTNGDCVVKDDALAKLVTVNASAAGAKSTTSERTNPVINTRTRIRIPAACTGETVEVTYDFRVIADVIKADPNAPGWTVKQRHRGDAARCDIDGDGLPDFGVQCPDGATGAYPNCSCRAGEEYEAETNSCWCDKPQADLIQRDGELYWAVRTYRNGYHCTYTDDQLDAQIVEWSWHLEGNTEKKGSLETPIRFGDLGPDTASIYEQYCLLEPTSIGNKSQTVISTAKLEDGTFMDYLTHGPVTYPCPAD